MDWLGAARCVFAKPPDGSTAHGAELAFRTHASVGTHSNHTGHGSRAGCFECSDSRPANAFVMEPGGAPGTKKQSANFCGSTYRSGLAASYARGAVEPVAD